MTAPRRPDPRRAAAHRGAGRARRLVHGARAVGDDVVRRRDRAGPRARRARLRGLGVLRLPDGRQRRQVPPLADARPRSTCATGRAYRMGEVLVQRELAETLKRMVAAEKRGGRQPRGGHPRGARRVLSRRDGQAHRRVPPRQRGPAGAERPRRVQRRGGAGAARRAFGELRGRRVRLLVPGPGAAADAEHARRHRPGGARPQLAGVPASPRGDDQARVRRSRRLLRRSELREGAGRAPAVEGVRRAAARAGARAGWQEMPPAGDADARARDACCRWPAARRTRSTPATWRSSTPRATAFSATPSDPNVDSPVVSGVGCVVSPRGSQGWLDPDHASVVAPGKRPRLTPAPAMALQDGKADDAVRHARAATSSSRRCCRSSSTSPCSACRCRRRSRRRASPRARSPTRSGRTRTRPASSRPSGAFPKETRDALAGAGPRGRRVARLGVARRRRCARSKVGPEGTRWGGADPRRGASRSSIAARSSARGTGRGGGARRRVPRRARLASRAAAAAADRLLADHQRHAGGQEGHQRGGDERGAVASRSARRPSPPARRRGRRPPGARRRSSR